MCFARRSWVIFALWIVFAGSRAGAHQANDSWLSFSLTNNAIAGQWDISVSDLDTALGLDDNDDGTVSEEELQAHQEAIIGFVLPHLQVKADGVPQKIKVTGHRLQSHLNGVYVGLTLAIGDVENSEPDKEPRLVPSDGTRRARSDAPHLEPQTLEVACDLFYDLNPKFLNRVSVEADGQQRTMNLTTEAPSQFFDFSKPKLGHQFLVFAREGVWHIWSGFDHILFLLALLLPSVLRREQNAWQPVGEFRKALVNVLKVVTAFTVAHSITLSLATLGVVQLPSRLTESAIAASVVVAAANNVFPMFTRREWMVAFGFGLVHGFGFASGLSDMGITRQNLAVTVMGFNLGVEAGQLAIVSVFLPVAYGLRGSWIYPRIVLAGGSSGIVLIAAVWLVERALILS